MVITISINSTEMVEINYEVAATIAAELADEPENSPFLSKLATHPYSEVRCAVACKTCLPDGVLRTLAQDSSVDVVKAVVNNEHALAAFDLTLIRGMIDRDVSVALSIAYSLCDIANEIRGDVIDYLLRHDDPKVVDVTKEYVQASELEESV